MNGVHDMGGGHGHGPVIREENEPSFHQPWEGKVYAMMRLVRGQSLFNLDEMRHAIERMGQARYLETSYYEHWLAALETLVVEKGLVSGQPRPSGPDPTDAPVLQPRYSLGQAVRTKNLNPPGHTRLPRYARAKVGTVDRISGPFLLPDANAHGGGHIWQPVYTVRFASAELWGEQGRPGDSVSIDLWESYLDNV